MDERSLEIEDRLIEFAVRVINVVEALPDTKAGKHVANQLVRSGTSPAPNYAEARAAESRADFVHKLKVALKELRETLVWLKVIEQKPMIPRERLGQLVTECNELIAIFVKSVQTADRNREPKRDTP